ncbi:tetratricopeptide repeat protein [Ferrimonas aestuarii]|uniref:Sel1 repeat family protein n=1 Tax=Ferrimonas aestuarii TaxID=2569539 RepID=A0A4U1BQR1_9GAMM|nr:tetratricopeptide repeat protein [Ferrimonas aestuarii]TKB55030.1 sel1 repeat family protein [Ferrimonas aestuarii]
MKYLSNTVLLTTAMLLSAPSWAYDLSIEIFEDEELTLLKTAETSDDAEVLKAASDLLIYQSMYQENTDRGYQYLKQVAETGDQEAMVALADAYYDNDEYDLSLAWYHKAEAGQDPYVLYSLGVMYFDGEGTEADMEKGTQYYLQAAKGGSSDAMYQLAFSYDNGDGIKQSYEKSAYWFGQAAALGDVSAAYNLGVAYLNGEGVDKSCPKAMELFTTAINEENHALSNAKMGDIFYSNRYKKACGLSKSDYNRSFNYFTEAAGQGDAYSQYMMALSYLKGHGVEKDKISALAWFYVADEYGDEDAGREIIKLKLLMSGEDIAKAEQLKEQLLEEIW